MPSKNTSFCKKLTLNCRGRLVDLSRKKIMGILNVSPDSFYDGGKHIAGKQMLRRVEQLLTEGADFIDVGGMSSRPGAKMISEKEELKRVVPALRSIAGAFPDALISIDTFRSGVALAAIQEGVSIVNDISSGSLDDNIMAVVGKMNVPYLMMHMKGVPANMQKDPTYKNVITDIIDFFIHTVSCAQSHGIKDIILDPGFGFGKTVAHNYEILRNLPDFRIFGCPIMAGISRKSMICKVLKVDPANALNGTTALHMLAVINGADILRVHDVKEAREVITLSECYIDQGLEPAIA